MKFNRIIEIIGSTVVDSLTYEPIKQVLDLKFKSGKLYRYRKVKPLEFAMLVTADSTGQVYNNFIKSRGGKAIKLRRTAL
jgi:hypothetical protein